jgi:hypothetical protein
LENNSGKDFMKVKTLLILKNYKEGDKKIPYQILQNVKADLVGIVTNCCCHCTALSKPRKCLE